MAMATPSEVDVQGRDELPNIIGRSQALVPLNERLRALRPAIEQICKLMGNVGVSFAVLHRGEIVLAEGHGHRDLENQKPADADTLYNIASCTKAFTATACAFLARDGVLALDAPAVTYLPELLDNEITLIDMMSHRTGYARLDPSWLGADSQLLMSHDNLLTRANGLPRAKPLRSVWMYNNWMYALVGEIIKRKGSHGSWEEFMEQEVLPLFEMSRSCVRKSQLPDDNVTRSYASNLSRQAMLVPDPPWEESPFAPGGGIRSSVKEMMVWAGFLLDSYAAEKLDHGEGSQSGKQHGEHRHPGVIFDPRMILPDDVSSGQLERSYGFGFLRSMLPAILNPFGRNSTVANNVVMPCVGTKANHVLVLTHNGENVGALSTLTLVPHSNSAVVVLGNTTALGDVTDLIAQMLIQEVLGLSNSHDYVALAERIVKECSSWHDRTLATPLKAHRILGTSVGKLEDYVGVYRDPDTHAIISVSLDSGNLFFHRGALESQKALLSHYHYETFSFSTTSYDEHMKRGLIDYDNWKQLLIEFERGIAGNVMGAKWLLDQDLSPLFLRKVKDS